MSINKQKDKLVYVYNRILLNNKKKEPNEVYMQQHETSRIFCWITKAKHKRVYTALVHFYEV